MPRDSLNRNKADRRSWWAAGIASRGGVEAAYRSHVLRALHPDLSPDRIDMLRIQAQFLWAQGFLDAPVDVAEWVDPAPLTAAIERLGRAAEPVQTATR